MAIPQKAVSDPTFLAAALEGLLLQKQRIEDQISTVRSLLGKSGGGRAASTSTPAAESRTKRTLSAAARSALPKLRKSAGPSIVESQTSSASIWAVQICQLNLRRISSTAPIPETRPFSKNTARVPRARASIVS